jgi:Yip1 domain
VATSAAEPSQRDWWLRALLVLQSPRAVFAALRDGSDEQVQARQEPVLAIVWLAGIAGVLSTNQASRLLDDFEIDVVVLAIWAYLAGGLHGLTGYFVVGALVLLGVSLAKGSGTYRLARHVLAFAAVPIAFSLVVWPVRLTVYGRDSFRSGGADTGAGNSVFEAIELGFLLWAFGLLVVGLRTVYGFSTARALAASLPAAVVPLLALARAYGLF